MNTQDAYNKWSCTYDTVINKTRDLEARAIRQVLNNLRVKDILEIGSGTGKNTAWLAEKCEKLIAADFSGQMLEIAKKKLEPTHIIFQEADITRPWNFPEVDFISCSLVLEHTENLFFIFSEAAATLKPGGQFFVCELHTYRQLSGSRAKFEKDGQLLELEYFIHHISDFFQAAKAASFSLTDLSEWFDDDDRSHPPGLVSFLFTKNSYSLA